ncbi:MAG: hypothetical protein M3527_02505, partial [Actinomycetota bacterium]|nr:hypothetical protein [Actinomycetota bacterium]
RVLYVEGIGNEALNRRRIQTGHALVELVERDAAGRYGAPPSGEPIGRIGAAILVGGFSELLQAWLAGRIAVPRDQLVDDATGLFLALGESAGKIAATRAGGGPTTGRRAAARRPTRRTGP